MKQYLAVISFLSVFSINSYAELIKVKYESFDLIVVIDKDFKKYTDVMDTVAQKYNLKICVQDSFRLKNMKVNRAIVVPYEKSNHYVGHAIDINIIHNNQLYNSTRLKKYEILPIEIKQFIQECKNNGLYWGGELKVNDVVHFDDGLNYLDPVKYDELINIYQ